MKNLTILTGIIPLAFLFPIPAQAAYVCNTGAFLLPASYPAGNTQNGSASIGKGDFDGDTHLDVVILNETGFSLLLGNGDGSFKAPAHLAGDQSFGSLAVGDLDGLGHLAVIAANYDHVFVYVSNGNGTFQSPVSFTRPFGGGPIALGDFDGDQNIDVLSESPNFDSLSVFLGNGNGTFQAAVTTPLSFNPGALAVGDFDGDQNLDVAVAVNQCCASSSLLVFPGDGAGGFASPSGYASGGMAQALVAVDVDTDSHMDLAASVGGFVSVLINAGDGTFDAPLEYALPSSSGPILWDDFDGNGTPDIAVLSPNAFSGTVGVSVLAGNGDGSFQPPAFFLFAGPAAAFVNGDFNEDGSADLAVTIPDRVAIVIGRGDGDFEAERLWSFANHFFASTPPALGDFDGDGIPDAVVANGNSPSHAFLLPGDGNRGFGDPVDLEIAATVVATADFNGDGHPDLAVSGGDFSFSALINDGSGSFAASSHSTPFPVNVLATGDFNNDHAVDIIGGPNYFNSAEVFLGDGDGGFSDAGTVTLATSPLAIFTADFNGDHYSDLLLVGNNDVQVMPGNGDGTFRDATFFASINQPSVAVADINGDDNLDIVVASATTSISVYLGNGNGTFKAPTIIGLAYPAIAVAAADFNADGKMDIATANSAGPGISVLIGKGNMTFFTPAEFAGSGNVIIPIDLTGGSHPDLISMGSPGIAVLRNSHVTVSRPPDAIACTNSTVHLAVHAAGRGTLTYQWRKNTVPLSDGGAILGSQEDTLTIQNPSPGDAGSYDVVVTDACGSATSDASTVTVQEPPADPVIAAPLTVAPNTSGLIASVPFHAGDTYFWTPFFATIDGGQGTSQISFTSPGPGLQIHFTVVETTAGGCESGVGAAAIQVDFLDVPPSNEFHDFIDALALHGVTFGCGNGNYCPDQTLPRDQMAAFIARAAVGTPPATGTIGSFSYDCDNGPSYFADVPVGSIFCAAIHYLASQSITIGCDPTPDFCPSDLVTREQMALFIGRALAPGATPPSSYSDGGTGRSYDCSIAAPFTDVAANTESCNAIGYIWAKGIVDGFGDGTFHPLDVLTRAPAAKFIANAFGLTLGL